MRIRLVLRSVIKHQERNSNTISVDSKFVLLAFLQEDNCKPKALCWLFWKSRLDSYSNYQFSHEKHQPQKAIYEFIALQTHSPLQVTDSSLRNLIV